MTVLAPVHRRYISYLMHLSYIEGRTLSSFSRLGVGSIVYNSYNIENNSNYAILEQEEYMKFTRKKLIIPIVGVLAVAAVAA